MATKRKIAAKKRKENKKVEEILESEEVAYYRGNPKLKRAGEKIRITAEQIEEYKRCMKDPVYFVSNYVKIIHVDKGLVPIELYDYQKKVLKEFDENRFSVLLSCRQSGKCISENTYIKLKNPKFNNGKEFMMKIGDFYNWCQFNEYCNKYIKLEN